MTHLSDFAIEEHLLGGGKHKEHLQGCERCQSRLAMFQDEGKHFRQFVYPATLEALEKRRRRSWVWMLAPVAMMAGAMVAVIAVRAQPSPEYIGTKGAALKLSVYTSAGPIADGASIPATSELRFRVQTSSACTVSLLSIDDTGSISSLYDGVPAQGETALPGGAQLDGHAGTERFFALCTPQALTPLQLENLVRGAGQGPVRDLPQGSTQTTLLVKKVP